MPNQKATMPRPVTAMSSNLETTILVGRAVALAAWDAHASMASATVAVACQPETPRLHLSA